MSFPSIPFPAPRSVDYNFTKLNLIDPPADGRAKFWGKTGMQKYFPPSGHIEDNQVVQDGCWKANISGEKRIKGQKKVDRKSGHDEDKRRATRMFLHHRGASRDSQRTHTIPGQSHRSRSCAPSSDMVQTLLQENKSLKNELRSMKNLIHDLSQK